jgi:hypothetical protein
VLSRGQTAAKPTAAALPTAILLIGLILDTSHFLKNVGRTAASKSSALMPMPSAVFHVSAAP